MRKISLLLLSVVLVSGCEPPEITRIKETDEYYDCVIQESKGLKSITSTIEKMIEKKCIQEYKDYQFVYEMTEEQKESFNKSANEFLEVWESVH